MVMIIGLTGGIGSGKSTIASMLLEYAIPVIDADAIARQLTNKPNTAIMNKLINEFGKDILTKEGTLDRRKLGGLVFNEERLLRKLEAILHPEIETIRQQHIKTLINQGHKIIVYMAPLLMEKKLQHCVSKILAVIADISLAKQRIKNRDHLSDEEIEQRIKSQLGNEERRNLADEVIENNGTLDELLKNLKICWLRLTGTPLRDRK